MNNYEEEVLYQLKRSSNTLELILYELTQLQVKVTDTSKQLRKGLQ